MQITIEGLNKRYHGGKWALREVDIEINAGLFGLLGPNGAGKTTLMRIIATLLKPTSGSVSLDGVDILRNRRSIRRKLGYLPQEFSLFPRLKTWEFLEYSASLAGIRPRTKRLARVDELLEQVGLFNFRDRRAGKLSGGMKRRLGIAQTLIGDPTVMIVDEPTVGLDPEERLRFRNILSDLTRREMIIILSTHIVGDISSTCGDMALIGDGRTLFKGSPGQLIEAARGKVWSVNASHEELDKLKEKYPVISTIPSEQGYEVRLAADEIAGYSAVDVEPNLEDAYICFMQSNGSGTAWLN